MYIYIYMCVCVCVSSIDGVAKTITKSVIYTDRVPILSIKRTG